MKIVVKTVSILSLSIFLWNLASFVSVQAEETLLEFETLWTTGYIQEPGVSRIEIKPLKDGRVHYYEDINSYNINLFGLVEQTTELGHEMDTDRKLIFAQYANLEYRDISRGQTSWPETSTLLEPSRNQLVLARIEGTDWYLSMSVGEYFDPSRYPAMRLVQIDEEKARATKVYPLYPVVQTKTLSSRK